MAGRHVLVIPFEIRELPAVLVGAFTCVVTGEKFDAAPFAFTAVAEE